MAYSDYGGYAFKNKERVEERSDAVLSPEGIKSTPGAWPGWTIPEGRGGDCFHALLGDGPIFVGLYKQSTLVVYRLGEEVADTPRKDWDVEGDQSVTFEIDGHKITAHWVKRDNYYQFVRLEQPDGAIWTGWSGYGVGAGLEEAGYGFSTEYVDELADDIWS